MRHAEAADQLTQLARLQQRLFVELVEALGGNLCIASQPVFVNGQQPSVESTMRPPIMTLSTAAPFSANASCSNGVRSGT